MVEQRAMRIEDVTLGRKMLATQAIEPALVGSAEQRGDDDGRGNGGGLVGQIST